MIIVNSKLALSDGLQSLDPLDLKSLISDLRPIALACNPTI